MTLYTGADLKKLVDDFVTSTYCVSSSGYMSSKTAEMKKERAKVLADFMFYLRNKEKPEMATYSNKPEIIPINTDLAIAVMEQGNKTLAMLKDYLPLARGDEYRNVKELIMSISQLLDRVYHFNVDPPYLVSREG